MNRSDIFKEVVEICKDVFNNEKLQISENTTAADIENWDSLTHLSLINELEEKYKIAFTLDESSKSKNIGELMNALMKHIEERER